jgi:anti-sigma factor RsiW
MVSRISRLFRRRDENEHVKARGLGSDYIDGDLDEEAAKEVESHLAICPPCTAFFETLKATVKLLGSQRKAEAPPSFRERLRDRVQREGN